MTAPVSAVTALRRAVVVGMQRALSAAVWLVLLTIIGIGSIVGGVYVLSGFGWALIAAGCLSVALAALLMVGANRA
jgi:hypothetical protein